MRILVTLQRSEIDPWRQLPRTSQEENQEPRNAGEKRFFGTLQQIAVADIRPAGTGNKKEFLQERTERAEKSPLPLFSPVQVHRQDRISIQVSSRFA